MVDASEASRVTGSEFTEYAFEVLPEPVWARSRCREQAGDWANGAVRRRRLNPRESRGTSGTRPEKTPQHL